MTRIVKHAIARFKWLYVATVVRHELCAEWADDGSATNRFSQRLVQGDTRVNELQMFIVQKIHVNDKRVYN
jgi:hypothetical protein